MLEIKNIANLSLDLSWQLSPGLHTNTASEQPQEFIQNPLIYHQLNAFVPFG